jgi:hypothetical protein
MLRTTRMTSYLMISESSDGAEYVQEAFILYGNGNFSRDIVADSHLHCLEALFTKLSGSNKEVKYQHYQSSLLLLLTSSLLPTEAIFLVLGYNVRLYPATKWEGCASVQRCMSRTAVCT